MDERKLSSSMQSAELTQFQMLKIKKIEDKIKSEAEALANHRIYGAIQTIEDLRIFMAHHIYCVWDFMNLIKRLQIEFTCCKVPFRPARNFMEEQVCRFLNEIVLEEESDELENGFISHFAFYCKAFDAILDDKSKCEFDHVFQFYDQVMQGDVTYSELLGENFIPTISKTFMEATRAQVEHEQVLVTASSFTFGREALLPLIFIELIKQPMLKDDVRLKRFELYLQRHIDLDGDIHSHLAKKLVASICKSEIDWNLAEKAAIDAIQSRLRYWDEVYDIIISEKSKKCPDTCTKTACNNDIESLGENNKKCTMGTITHEQPESGGP